MADDFSAGQLLSNRFEIVALVGRGGMSAVYEARDTVLGRTVAIKVFTVDSSDDRARLESEVRLLSMLRQPTLITVHDAYLAASPVDEPSFLVMEFIEGESLGEVIASRELSPVDIGRVALDIGEALVAVHRAGIVHRDVKPANILIESGDDQAGVLLECFTRRREFPGTPAESLSARMARSPEIPSDLPVGWSQLLGGMLAQDPSVRSTAAEVVAAARLLADEDTRRLPTPIDEAMARPATEDIPTRVLPFVANQPPRAEPTVRDDGITARIPRAEDEPSDGVETTAELAG